MLPDILPVAERHGLIINDRTRGKREVLAKCPFCGEDSKPEKERKYYLSLNTEDQVYKCWFCGESGGVFRFISLLEGISEDEVVEKYRKQKGKKYKPHPAERLTTTQLKLIGYQKKPDWAEIRKGFYDYYLDFRTRLWNEWKAFMEDEKYFAFQQLVLGITNGTYQKVVRMIKEREQEIGAPLLGPVLKIYSMSERPKWAEEAERNVLLLFKKTNIAACRANKSAAGSEGGSNAESRHFDWETNP